MSLIFVSYRRSDAAGHAGRIYDRLVERFGEPNVFKDIDSMEPGADFNDVIADTIARCDAVIAVIGREWLGTGPDGKRRLDDPADWVHLELSNAFKREVRVVPVLVQDAQIPAASELPQDISALARRHGVELRESAWNAQVEQLLVNLERALASAPPRSAQKMWTPSPSTQAAVAEAMLSPARSPEPSDWQAKLVRTTKHSRIVQLARGDESFVVGFEVTMLTGMAKVTIDGETQWKGAANAGSIPTVYYVPAASSPSRYTVNVERRRVLGVNIVQALRIIIDGNVAYDEGY